MADRFSKNIKIIKKESIRDIFNLKIINNNNKGKNGPVD